MAQKRKRPDRPVKPYPEFPLYPHPAGVWAKVIGGRTRYFGPWRDPEGALDRYLKIKDHLHAGMEPPGDGQVTVHELVNRYLDSQRRKADNGEISIRHFEDCRRDGARVIASLGRARPVATLGPGDFGKLRGSIIQGHNPTSTGTIIVRIRCIFSWGHRSGLLDRLVNYGGEFSRPSAKALRKARAARGGRIMTAADLRTLLEASKPHRGLHAMILMGINCGMGNTDLAQFPLGNLHLDDGYHDFPRPKTGAARRAILWPATVKALQAVQDGRKDVPTDLAGRVFVTRMGQAYVRRNANGTEIDSISTQFRKLMERCGVYRPGLGFYSLRHTFRTTADETRDFPAVDLVMGHIPSDSPGAPFAIEMGDRYRGRIGDNRLKAISEHVRKWLFKPSSRKAIRLRR